VAFVIPQFPLAVSIWRVNGVGGIYAAPDVSTVGNLSPGERAMTSIANSGAAPNRQTFMILLLPKLADIRAAWNGNAQDVVEVPAGSKRFYSVNMVDDVGKGFQNEHRFALLVNQPAGNANLAGGPYAFPVPLP